MSGARPAGAPGLPAKVAAEGLGTFLFVFVGAGSIVLGTHTGEGAGGLVGVALAHGLALAIVVSAFGFISGGHINPAVTVALWVAGRIDATGAAAYMVAQLVGAAIAAFALRSVFPESSWAPTAIGAAAMGEGITVGGAIGIEAILTAVLLVAVFGTAVDPRAPRLGGMAIGLSVTADVLMGGPLTGAAMNPARWFGPAVAAGAWDNWFVWIIGPLVGAVAVAVVWRYLLSDGATAPA